MSEVACSQWCISANRLLLLLCCILMFEIWQTLFSKENNYVYKEHLVLSSNIETKVIRSLLSTSRLR